MAAMKHLAEDLVYKYLETHPEVSWEEAMEYVCGDMITLENWKEVTKGLYRYVISAGCCYEIHIMYHAKDTDILTANASLYIVGDWTSAEDNSKFFNRELLINGPLMACLEKAVEDEKEMRG